MKQEKEIKLFKDNNDEAYASMGVGRRVETMKIRSSSFEKLLCKLHFEENGSALRKDKKEELLSQYEAQAIFGGEVYSVCVRVAQTPEGIEIDLANELGECVLVTKTGWVITQPKSFFLRPAGMLPLPVPVRGDFTPIWQALNLPDEKSQKLVKGFITGCFNPRGPFPLFILEGEQGCGKSTIMTYLRQMIDPNISPKGIPPKSESDIFMSTQNNWILSYDNLSGAKAHISDALCRLTTGGTFKTRKLYTTSDELLITACNPVILNGIDGIATRGDLASRAITLHLTRVVERRTTQELDKLVELYQTAFFAHICDGLVSALANKGKKIDEELPRMADFVQFVTEAESGLGLEDGEFARLFKENQTESYKDNLANEPLVEPLLKLLAPRHVGKWEGTPTELYEALAEKRSCYASYDFPKSPKELSFKLNRLKPLLQELGVVIEKNRSSNKRLIMLIKTDKFVHDDSIQTEKLKSESAVSQPTLLVNDNHDAHDAEYDFLDELDWGEPADLTRML